jgi:Flp pilus assembly pilin Flp
MKRSEVTINQPLVRNRGRRQGEVSALIGTDRTHALTTVLTLRELPTMKNLIARFVCDDQGQDLIEYALLGSFVSLAAIVGATFLGTEINGWYNAVGTRVNTAAGVAAS